MADSFDDMPEIELDDIVAPSKKTQAVAAEVDTDAIDLDLDVDPVIDAPPSPAARAVTDDEDAIDLGLDLESAQSLTSPLADIDVDALASQVAQSQPEVGDDVPVIPDGQSEPAAVTERPSVPSPGEGAVDLDALLADLDSGLPANESAPSRIQSNVDALPDIDADALSALNFELEVETRRETVELSAADVDLDEDPLTDMDVLEQHYSDHDQTVEMDASAPTMETPAMPSVPTVEVQADVDLDDPEVESELEVEAEVEAEVVEGDGDLTPEPLLEVLADDPTTADAAQERDEAALTVDSAELSFQAEHAPIVGDGLGDQPMTIAPVDDPSAPPLPLSADEPAGRPKVPLSQLRPDPKTIETLKRLAGPGGDPDRARVALLAAFRGEHYNHKAIPDARDIAVGLGRFLVQQGYDADALAETIVSVMIE